ncbi:DUF1800 domain-containing protein [Seonamhaeicola aphaedonensis]|uniref:Uncharacterized protein (DUF1800 family) n=1 Tax=Seonamhaeicola aphaedonensis TaxID=1461338 RepID=A0A3D9HH89_9FLAO|nr:DUF1800 domain-containing protein [Seonamhaeicola aphaedonensis]RED48745.1 uncharacterized protein (DUF1800 family) [Seonamhaeicola aphaedonensis]
MNQKYIQHLYRRLGFGIQPNDLHKLLKLKRKEVVNNLFKASKNITPLELDTSELKSLMGDSYITAKPNIQKIQKLSRLSTLKLNHAWIERLTSPKELIREKMTLFWANHFVCEDNNFIYTQNFQNTLRKHALGNFRDFVVAVSKQAAMTKYLNTKQNKKQKPNENFARELMELFTLGVGHYTEQDIKESAKAFTGYSHNMQGGFVFRRREHHEGQKTFFGKTGNFNGDDIIDIILEQRRCAEYICEKVYRYFVNDTLNKSHVQAMTDVFYKDYNIEKLMHFVCTSNWFYNEENIGTKIKSPIEFLVGIKTIVPVVFKNERQLLNLQRLMGQILLDPPNVAGWKGGQNWIDSNTITLRLKLPSLLLNNSYISNSRTGQVDNQIKEKKHFFKRNYGGRFNVESNWNYFNQQFINVNINELDSYILACNLSPVAQGYLNTLEKVSKQEYCVQLMSLPEYQMC